MLRKPQFMPFFGNLETLENLIFSDIFWKVKTMGNIVFHFKLLSFLKKKSR